MGKLEEYLRGFSNKSVAVIGAGISNTPLIEALIKEGIKITIRDKRTDRESGDSIHRYKEAGAGLMLGDDYLDELSEDVIFRTPGLMPSNPALREAVLRGATLTSEMEAFFEICPCKIIGITGSDGKTTTTAIISELLKNQGKTVHMGGNIGTPLLCSVNNMTAEDIAVVELSSFQLITMKKSPDIAVVTNLNPNHLDIHTSFDEYMRAKKNIFIHQKQGDKAVFNFDNDITRSFANEVPGSDVLFFSLYGEVKNGFYLSGDEIKNTGCSKITRNTGDIVKDGVVIMKTSGILLPGTHNVANYLAAFAAVDGIVSTDVMRKTAGTFTGVAHRLELVRELNGVRYYNDSIASSPTRTIAGLRSFEQKVILIAGGKDKGITFDELGSEIISRVKKLIVTGMAANQIKNAVINSPEYNGQLEIAHFDDFTEAVTQAAGSAQNGDIVLLSPACTSFDRFSNFEQRGDTFRSIVNNLI